jgi:hypothetical protein
MVSRLEKQRHDPVFLSQSSPIVLLSPDLVIRATTPSYLSATGRHADELIGVNILEAFPENPTTPSVGSHQRLIRTLETVLRTRRPDQVSPVRYDLQDPENRAAYLERRWAMATTVIRDGDEVIGLSHRVQDLTMVDEHLVEALRAYRDVLAEGDLRTISARRRLDVAESFLALVESHEILATEVRDLRRVLDTRPTIDQAKGIIMADRRCGPDEAFDVLRKLSMDTNVRVADVAAALVYQAQAADG